MKRLICLIFGHKVYFITSNTTTGVTIECERCYKWKWVRSMEEANKCKRF